MSVAPIKLSHKIVESEKASNPVLSKAGLLADDMGLGKTLTMLSAIVDSQADALDFATLQYTPNNDAGSQMMKTKSTLVVVPSRGP